VIQVAQLVSQLCDEMIVEGIRRLSIVLKNRLAKQSPAVAVN
jgi:hypothetical protein